MTIDYWTMNMGLKDRLAGGFAGIGSDIEPGDGRIIYRNDRALFGDNAVFDVLVAKWTRFHCVFSP